MIWSSPYPDVTIPEVSYSDFILQNVPKWKDKPVFIDGPSGRTLTFGQVAGGARLVAAGLAQRGFKHGDVFSIFLPNLPEYAVAFHSVLMLGGVVTTANPLYTPDELAFQLNDTRAKFILTIPMFVEKVKAAIQGTQVQEIFVLGEAEGATPFADLMKSGAQPPQVTINPRTDLAVIPYSSGTSGRPKGVLLTHYNLVAVTCQAGVPTKNYDETSRTIGILPFFHIYGMVALMNFPLYKGGTCVTLPRFDLEQFLKVSQDYGITHMYLVPPIVLALAKHPLVAKYDLSKVKQINSGAAPLDDGVSRLAQERIGALVTQGYGMTETSIASHVTPDDPAKVKLGSVGVLLPNMQCKIIGVATGAELGPNEDGEVCVRGPNIMQGYLNNPVETANTLDKEGWLHTGDVGHVDADGYLFVVDRVKELIKYKGMQVAPAELEAALLAHPAVADAAVIPSPDDEAGEVPKAFVVLRSPQTPDELMAFVAARVAPHKKIRRLEIVDTIPKSASGKILRRMLVEQERAKK